jgi:hypothetical protein
LLFLVRDIPEYRDGFSMVCYFLLFFCSTIIGVLLFKMKTIEECLESDLPYILIFSKQTETIENYKQLEEKHGNLFFCMNYEPCEAFSIA